MRLSSRKYWDFNGFFQEPPSIYSFRSSPFLGIDDKVYRRCLWVAALSFQRLFWEKIPWGTAKELRQLVDVFQLPLCPVGTTFYLPDKPRGNLQMLSDNGLGNALLEAHFLYPVN